MDELNTKTMSSCATDDDDTTVTEGPDSHEEFEADSDISGELDTDDEQDLLPEPDLDSEDNLDAQEQLGEWLGQLHVLSQELDSVRPTAYKKSKPIVPTKPRKSTTSTSSLASSSTDMPAIAVPVPTVPEGDTNGLVKTRAQKPTVPPKPPLDTLRYSMVNMQDSPDSDIDALLNELSLLETQLQSMGPMEENPFIMQCSASSSSGTTTCHTGTAIGAAQQHSPPNAHSQANTTASSSAGSGRTHSPDDVDSAFGDASSLMSSESNGLLAHAQHGHTTAMNGRVRSSRDSHDLSSSNASSHGSCTTPSSPVQSQSAHCPIPQRNEPEHDSTQDNTPTNAPIDPNITEEQRLALVKAEKIKLALDKMKEANIKKLYVKFFTADGGNKSLLVDERLSVLHVLGQLAEKHHVAMHPNCAIVEHYPDLYMERVYEDHEQPVENILMWTRDSANKLYFVSRPDKYAVFVHPQRYLLPESSNERTKELPAQRKQQLIEEFFSTSQIHPPELEGWLHLKADGKKAWKKHYFVLRASGLYYVPKGKSKSTKDLQCLMNLEMNQIYSGFGWRKKYKAPSDFGFALKHPQIQVKASKYIKYLCADDQATADRWVVGLRVAKHKQQLLDNYTAIRTGDSNSGQETPVADCEPSAGHVAHGRAPSAASSHTASMSHSSTSADTCNNNNTVDGAYVKEAIVQRPRGSSNGSHQDNGADVKLRPRSADIQRGGPKRNSRSLVQCDLPTIPDELPAGCEATQYNDTLYHQHSQSINNHHANRSSVDQVEHCVSVNNGSPLHHQQMYTNKSMNNGAHGHVAGQQDNVSLRSGSSSQTGSSHTNLAPGFNNGHGQQSQFMDSQVTDTIKRAPCDVARRLAPVQVVVGHHVRDMNRHSSQHSQHSLDMSDKEVAADADSDEEDFPPPPSPQQLVGTVISNGHGHHDHSFGVNNNNNIILNADNKAMNGHRHSTFTADLPDSPSHGPVSGRKQPPPPPRRSEGTKLTCTPVRGVDKNGAPPPPPLVAPKQRVNGTNGNAQAAAPNNTGAPDFQSELQMAMQRRLAKMSDAGN